MDRLDLRIRTAGYNLDRIPSVSYILRDLKQFILQEQVLLRRIVPVQDKPDCQRGHRRSFDAEMRIPPVAELLVSSQVLSPHIESAHKTDSAVDDDDLPVIAVVHAELELSEQCGEELRHLDSLLFEALPVFVMHGAAPHTVEEHPHLDSLMRLLDQDLLYLLPELVVPNDIVLYMDILPRLFHLLDQSPELLLSVRIDPDIIIVREDSLARLQIVENQITEPPDGRIDRDQLLLGDSLLLLSDSIFQLSFDLLRLEHPALVKILSDHQVQDKPQDRYKIKQKQPCPDSLRGSSLKKDNDQGQEHIYNDQIVHYKVIDRHRSVPNCFCHK